MWTFVMTLLSNFLRWLSYFWLCLNNYVVNNYHKSLILKHKSHGYVTIYFVTALEFVFYWLLSQFDFQNKTIFSSKKLWIWIFCKSKLLKCFISVFCMLWHLVFNSIINSFLRFIQPHLETASTKLLQLQKRCKIWSRI